jgi:hypothetical protein
VISVFTTKLYIPTIKGEKFIRLVLTPGY